MRYSIGRVVATAAVAASVPEQVIIGLLDRHAARDWGDLDAENKAANDADEHGTIWVITDDLRGDGGGPTTTVLFPDEY
jgi:hypothetical protein